MSSKSTREGIVEAADRLFYELGYEHTSFADIAGTVRISRGNFYYHFKSKDEMLSAVVERRLEEARERLARWERGESDPVARIRNFIHILTDNRAEIKRYGCPLGTLSDELAKLGHAAQTQVNAQFTLYRGWLRRQFTLLGRKADADQLAMQLLARRQGAATLANAFDDEKFIKQEVKRMCDWLNSCVGEATPDKGSET